MPVLRHTHFLLAGLLALIDASFLHAPAQTTLGRNLQVIRRLPTPAGVDWILSTGPNALGPRNGQVLYIRAEGDTTPPDLMHGWHMPGKLIDRKSREPFYEAEVFVGEVLPDTIGVIWYDRSLMPDGLWHENTVLLDLTGIDPDTLVFFGHGRKHLTQRLAFEGKCTILDGLEQRITP